ncbi:MAG: 50S ribosomal protein L9 [Gammaproteobacteria bacterium RIFOXYA12_FULL_61_12]|nr:MAG: 50S ribosomal protein L9 [Gammaproteobacteria bacterium RIFOXYA12_FULL_61_12]OGT91355.1 MAG: 50S ribosomal protein L9 [Gammaproteobacteria bacterium RIFOXYD12_FULL_61_37]
MDVILLKKVENLGSLGEKVSVRPGYGRNFLIPTGAAVSATAGNVKLFEERRAELEKQAADSLQSAEQRKAKLAELGSVTIAAKAGDEGRLFGSVGASDIVDACVKAGVEVSKKEVRLSSGPFHTTGEFDVTLHLHTDVNAEIKLRIVPQV